VNIDQIEIHVGKPGFEYEPIRNLEAKSESRSAFTRSPNEADVNMQLRKLAASVGADAVINVEYNRGVSMSSWNSLKGTGLAVKKVSTDTQCPVCAETIKRAAKKCRFCGADLATMNVGTSPVTTGDPIQRIRQAVPQRSVPKPHHYTQEPLKSTDNNRGLLIAVVVIAVVLMLIGMLAE
jgi:hypothetical protein